MVDLAMIPEVFYRMYIMPGKGGGRREKDVAPTK
jgi:hypothetical protein